MNIHSVMKGEYLAAVELPTERAYTLEIDDVKIVELEDLKTGKPRERAVLFWVGRHRGLVLNKVNARRLAAMFGDETDAWKGKRMTFHREEVMAFGERVAGIRVVGSPDIASDIRHKDVIGKRKVPVLLMVTS